MTDRPKPGQRFVHKVFLDNEAFAAGKRDVHATHVVTATRRWGSEIAVYHTSAEQYDAGNRTARWYFDLSRSNESVKEWL